MTSVRLENISKHFGPVVALDDITLNVAPGELLFLLGPSGCGKSTLLRIIAGLLDPTSGRILFNDTDVTRHGTAQRNAVMCFQNYALWPHMTVRQNVGFGLALHKELSSDRQARITEALRRVQIEQYADLKPAALSGGQQQRAALARAMAVEPRCLLLDEPLSNLDSKLRLEMRSEIRRICKSVGYTTIYVTHDQKEALSIADRIVLLREGRIAQVGTPSELYYQPRSGFVADFIGQTNLLTGAVVERSAGGLSVNTPAGILRTAAPREPRQTVTLSIRPECIRMIAPNSPAADSANRLPGKLIETTFLGETSEHLVDVGGTQLKVTSSPPILAATGDVVLEILPTDCVLLEE